MLPRPRLLVLAALALGASGCALLAPAAQPLDDAHVVALTRPTCPYVVVKTQGDGFGILRALDPLEPGHGDMFVGQLRIGAIPMRFLPFPEQVLGPPVLVEVRAAGRSFAQAQAGLRELCPSP